MSTCFIGPWHLWRRYSKHMSLYNLAFHHHSTSSKYSLLPPSTLSCCPLSADIALSLLQIFRDLSEPWRLLYFSSCSLLWFSAFFQVSFRIYIGWSTPKTSLVPGCTDERDLLIRDRISTISPLWKPGTSRGILSKDTKCLLGPIPKWGGTGWEEGSNGAGGMGAGSEPSRVGGEGGENWNSLLSLGLPGFPNAEPWSTHLCTVGS